jgi:hypothetical protein
MREKGLGGELGTGGELERVVSAMAMLVRRDKPA